MRDLTDENKIHAFMRAFGRLAKSETAVFFTGGVTAVLVGWRDTTVDIDLKIVPELDELFRGIPQIKDGHGVNIELASLLYKYPAIDPATFAESVQRFVAQSGKDGLN